MKTQNAAGQFVVGKVNASVVVKVAELNETTVMAAISSAMQGMVVGVQPRTPVNKKANIEEAEAVVADLNDRLAFITEPVGRASVETAGAQQKQSKGEVKTMTKQGQFNSRDEWASAQDQHPGARVEHKNSDRSARNANVGRFQSHAETVAHQRFIDLGEYPITVVGIEWFPKADRFNRLGAITVQLPEGFADVSYYDRAQRKSLWYDFIDFDINQFKQDFNPPFGSGLLTLAIRERGGELEVRLPKSKSNKKDGRGRDVYYDKLRVRDIRFGKPFSDNNRNLEAAVTAFLRFYAGEFKQANPKNRGGIDEHCGSCKFNMYVPGYDGMDNEEEGFKNTLNTSDTIEMVQWGNEIPRRFCMVHKELVDLEVVKEINELAAMENEHYFDENGNIRYLRPQELLIAGKAVNKYVAIKEGTAERCASCPFYHGNSPKTDAQIAKEKAEGKEYVSKYWSEEARAERMPIQTLVNNGQFEEWVTAYPGETDKALDFRVFGIGGIMVYGSEEIAQAALEGGVLGQVPMTEEEDVVETRASKIINYVHHTCNNMLRGTLEEGVLDRVLGLLDEIPAGISQRTQRRLDGSVKRLQETIIECQG